jgi:hypothetical protein
MLLAAPVSLIPRYASPETFPLSLHALIPSLPEMPDFSAAITSAGFQLPDGVRIDETSGIPMLGDKDSPAARFMLLILVIGSMMMMRYVFSERFREVISDICSMLLAIGHDGR